MYNNDTVGDAYEYNVYTTVVDVKAQVTIYCVPVAVVVVVVDSASVTLFQRLPNLNIEEALSLVKYIKFSGELVDFEALPELKSNTRPARLLVVTLNAITIVWFTMDANDAEPGMPKSVICSIRLLDGFTPISIDVVTVFTVGVF